MWVGVYLVVDIGEERADGEAEGVLRFVGEPEGEDIPGCRIGDDLIFQALGQLIGLCLHLSVHHPCLLYKCEHSISTK